MAIASTTSPNSTNLGSMNPVNPAAAIEISDGAVVLPDTHTYDVLAGLGRFLKFALLGMDTDRPSVYFINSKTHDYHYDLLDAVGLDYEQNVYFGEISYDPIQVALDGSQGVYRYSINFTPIPLLQPYGAYPYAARRQHAAARGQLELACAES